jgi:hypothetical protein
MPRTAKGLSSPGKRSDERPEESSHANSERLAALARLNFESQRPTVIVPTLQGVPPGYSRVVGDDTSLTLAESLVKAGFGSLKAWKGSVGCSQFAAKSLQEWLHSLGANDLGDHTELHFCITNSYENQAITDGRVMALIECEASGEIVLGKPLAAMAEKSVELARDFYTLYLRSIWRWMSVYDQSDAERLVSMWEENFEYEAEAEGQSLEEYMKAQGNSLPDLDSSMPECLRDFNIKSSPAKNKQAAKRLLQHLNGPFGEWIRLLLEMWSIKPILETNGRSLEFEWEGSPLPTWCIRFDARDGINQCFDEEAQGWLEYSHAPQWLHLFDPGSVKDLKAVLTEVQKFVRVNQLIVQLNEAFQTKEKRDESTRSSRKRGQLLAA